MNPDDALPVALFPLPVASLPGVRQPHGTSALGAACNNLHQFRFRESLPLVASLFPLSTCGTATPPFGHCGVALRAALEAAVDIARQGR